MKEVRTLSAFGFVAQSLKLNPPSTQSYSSLQLYAKASKPTGYLATEASCCHLSKDKTKKH